jgi:hypothetical protein
MLDELLKSQIGVMLISIIWGLGLSTLFNTACKGRNCYIIKGPNIENTTKKYFNYGTDKCYQYYPVITGCR